MKSKRDIILENTPLPKKDPNWKPLNLKDHPWERDHCFKFIEIPKVDFNYSIDYSNKITTGFNAGKELYSIEGFDYSNKKNIDNIEKLKMLIPTSPRVYFNSALIYIALNDRETALDDLREGLKYADLDPETGQLMRELIEQLENQ